MRNTVWPLFLGDHTLTWLSLPLSQGLWLKPVSLPTVWCRQVLLYTCSGQLNHLLEATQVPLLRSPKEVNWKQFSVFLQPTWKAGEGGRRSSADKGNSPFLHRSVLRGFSPDWMMPTHTAEADLLYSVHWFKCQPLLETPL